MRIKMVVVGSNLTVKRNLLTNFKEQKTERDYLPSVINNFLHTTEIDEKRCEAVIWDTSGSEDYYRTRQLSYPETSVFLLAYSKTDIHSFAAVPSYYSEISSACPRAAVILVSVDMQERDNAEYIPSKEGRRLAQELTVPFLTCEINNLDAVNQVFQSAMKQGLEAVRLKKIQQGMQFLKGPEPKSQSGQKPDESRPRLTRSL